MLIIGAVIASLVLVNGLYPIIGRSNDAVIAISGQVNDRLQTDIRIIQVSDSATEIDFWVKNVGTVDILAVENCDIFYGPEDNFARVVYAASGPPYPYWSYEYEGTNTKWQTAGTIHVTIYVSPAPSAGTYMLKVVLPNGISHATTFGIS